MLARLASSARTSSKRVVPTLRRSFYKTNEPKQFNDLLYNVFMKSNVAYSTAVVGVAIFGGMAYDSVFEGLWKANNRGKLFEDVIEQSFPNPPEGTEEEEEEEDDDDDDDDDDE
mmetsp:Transcript_9544/g.11400  ORF Transcript_9544/g.11400 Transcript_9544/m.11400 type:complete len:114 (-) Transcript_9544:84-425(-)